MAKEAARIGCTNHLWEDFIPNAVDQSFTVSYGLNANNWVFFHDYHPDLYFHTREEIFSVYNGQARRHNDGPYGNYDGLLPRPFFIDIAVPFGNNEDRVEHVLNSIQWLGERGMGNLTFTHITIWNSEQCTGRIPLTYFKGLQKGNIRETKGYWSFDIIRDITTNANFLDTIFNDFQVLAGSINTSLPWYEKSLIEDNFVIIRLEYDNSTPDTITLLDINLDLTKDAR